MVSSERRFTNIKKVIDFVLDGVKTTGPCKDGTSTGWLALLFQGTSLKEWRWSIPRDPVPPPDTWIATACERLHIWSHEARDDEEIAYELVTFNELAPVHRWFQAWVPACLATSGRLYWYERVWSYATDSRGDQSGKKISRLTQHVLWLTYVLKATGHGSTCTPLSLSTRLDYTSHIAYR